jgi:uncharacterized protein with GYD domain
MVRYLLLLKFTEEGISHVQDSVARGEAFKAACQQAGVTVESAWWTLGEFDGVVLLKGLDEATVVGQVLGLAKLGRVRTCLLRAFDAAEFKNIVAKMP